LIGVKREVFATDTELANEAVKINARGLSKAVAHEKKLIFVFVPLGNKRVQIFGDLAIFKIFLTVEGARLHEAGALNGARREHYQVCRKSLLILNHQDVPDSDFVRSNQDKRAVPKCLDFLRVRFVVRLVPHIIFNSFADHRHRQHEDQGQPGCRRVQRRYGRDGLQDCDEQKVEVRQTSELVKQTKRQKVPLCIPGCSNVV